MLRSAAATDARNGSSARSEAFINSAVVTASRSAVSFAPSNRSVNSSRAAFAARPHRLDDAAARSSMTGSNRLEPPPARGACRRSAGRGTAIRSCGATLGRPRVTEVQSSKFKVQSSKFKVQSSKFKVQSSKFKVQSSKFKVQSSKFKVQSSKFKVQSSKFKVQSSKFKVQSSKEAPTIKWAHLSFLMTAQEIKVPRCSPSEGRLRIAQGFSPGWRGS